MIMVDIESYSELPIAAIASIGAVKFDLINRTILDEFYVTIDPKSSKSYNLHFSKKTLDWWRAQPYDVRAALRENNISLDMALNNFTEWVGKEFDKICCQGMFDIPILQYSYYVIGSKEPWNYYDTIDCRTIAELYGQRIDRTSGNHHNALDDAKNQAKFLINLLNPMEE